MKRATLRALSIALLALALISVTVGLLVQNTMLLMVLFGITVGSVIAERVLTTRYNRCPYCKKKLRRSMLFAKTCPDCHGNMDNL